MRVVKMSTTDLKVDFWRDAACKCGYIKPNKHFLGKKNKLYFDVVFFNLYRAILPKPERHPERNLYSAKTL